MSCWQSVGNEVIPNVIEYRIESVLRIVEAWRFLGRFIGLRVLLGASAVAGASS
jgi:hypothetical protein